MLAGLEKDLFKGTSLLAAVREIILKDTDRNL
jgi:hypothetical protein